MSCLQAHAAPRAEHSVNENEEELIAEHSANNIPQITDNDIEINFEREIEFYSSKNEVSMIDDRTECLIDECLIEDCLIDFYNRNEQYWYTLYLVDGKLVHDSKLLLNKTEKSASGNNTPDIQHMMNDNHANYNNTFAGNEANSVHATKLNDGQEEESSHSESSSNSSATADSGSSSNSSATADSESSSNSNADSESRCLVENEIQRVTRIGQRLRQRLLSRKKYNDDWLQLQCELYNDDFELGLVACKRKRERDAANSEAAKQRLNFNGDSDSDEKSKERRYIYETDEHSGDRELNINQGSQYAI